MNRTDISNTIIKEIIKSLKNPKDYWAFVKKDQFLTNNDIGVVLYSPKEEKDNDFSRYDHTKYVKEITNSLFQTICVKELERSSEWGHGDFSSYKMPLKISFLTKIRLNLAIKERIHLRDTEQERMDEQLRVGTLNKFLNNNTKLKRNAVINELIED